MKKIGIFMTCVLILGMIAGTGHAIESEQRNSMIAIQSAQTHDSLPPITPFYLYTDEVFASLIFNGNQAKCNGSVSPDGDYAVSVTVTLYKQSGTKWVYVTSWTDSSTGGTMVSTGGSVSVGSGTYKVTTRGNVGGKEYPSKSVTKTKP